MRKIEGMEFEVGVNLFLGGTARRVMVLEWAEGGDKGSAMMTLGRRR